MKSIMKTKRHTFFSSYKAAIGILNRALRRNSNQNQNQNQNHKTNEKRSDCEN